MSNKLNSIRDKEAKESYETDKQRTSNIKEAGIIGKRFFLVFKKEDTLIPLVLKIGHQYF